MVSIKSKREIELMREACRVTALVHKELEKNIRPGISTLELDKIAERVIRENGGIPAQKGYNPGVKGVPPFPASICTSINDEVIHGVPSSRVKLKEGDVVSIDLVVLKDGFNGDAARTYIVGKGSKQAYDLLNVTEQAFFEGIKYAVKGNRIGDVCHAIGEFVTKNGYSVVKEFQGHGIGRQMHEDPGIPNYGRRGKGAKLVDGMVICIEPMINVGSKNVFMARDGWAVHTYDHRNSAHFELTVVVRKGQAELLSSFDFIEKDGSIKF